MSLHGGDQLASGARSAQFSAGSSSVNDPVELKNVAPEKEEEKFTVTDRRPSYLSLPSVDKAASEETQVVDPNTYGPATPILDRILVRRVLVNPYLRELEDGSAIDTRTGLVTAAKYRQHSNTGIVLGVGDFVCMGGIKHDLKNLVNVGDRVTFGDYNSEVFPMEESQIKALCAAVGILYTGDEEATRIVRIQDVRVIERRIKSSKGSEEGLVDSTYTEAR